MLELDGLECAYWIYSGVFMCGTPPITTYLANMHDF